MTATSAYREDQRVEVYPFSRQVEGDEAVIGRPDLAVFLVVPVEALELLDELAAGKTVAEVRAAHRARHGEDPDLAGLLEQLGAKGFVWPEGEADSNGYKTAEGEELERFRGHFQWIPRSVARLLFGPVGLSAVAAVAAAALSAAVAEPGIVPTWEALFFPEHFLTMVPALILLHCVAIFFHEMGHLLAARAKGVPARLGIGHRLWMVVAETDMTGIWTVDRRRRYLPLVAGPVVDVAISSSLLLLLFADARNLVELSEFVSVLIPALLLRYLLGLVWQCYFFVRTDLYYVIANSVGTKNLLGDTEHYLKTWVDRLLGRTPRDLSHIPGREMRAIRAYAPVWLLGRLAALTVLALIHLPLLFNYLQVVVETLDPRTEAASLDVLVMSIVAIGSLGLGMTLWLRSLLRSKGDSR